MSVNITAITPEMLAALDPATRAVVEQMAKEHAELKAKASQPGHVNPLKMKVAEKGGISVSNINVRFPVTLYRDQWVRVGKELFSLTDEQIATSAIGKFAAANSDKLSSKPAK